ncbi:hypothetical protein [Halorubellus sp. PRR65]|uniref:hypothetical protein n=1 Tax=Halorubellus sp. PRR65 TaxID=3098148 RepID=UPI002B25C4DF|nr:hypothetical protein [Halorubellus sp. PRR65]
MSHYVGPSLLAAGVLVLALSAVYQVVQREFDGVFFLSVALCCVFAGGYVAL